MLILLHRYVAKIVKSGVDYGYLGEFKFFVELVIVVFDENWSASPFLSTP